MMILISYALLAAGLGVLALLSAIALVAAMVKLAAWTVMALVGLSELRQSWGAALSEQLKTAQGVSSRYQKGQGPRVAPA